MNKAALSNLYFTLQHLCPILPSSCVIKCFQVMHLLILFVVLFGQCVCVECVFFLSGRTFWAWKEEGRADATLSSPPLSEPAPPLSPTSSWSETTTPTSCSCSSPWPERLEILQPRKARDRSWWRSAVSKRNYHPSGVWMWCYWNAS